MRGVGVKGEIMRKIFQYIACLVVGLGAIGAGGEARATTLSYTSDSIVEFDMFHQWSGISFLSAHPSGPVRAGTAALQVGLTQDLVAGGRYAIGKYGAPAGHQLIDDFSLSVQTDRGSYALGAAFHSDFRLLVETSGTGSISHWEISWQYSSGADRFSMQGDSTGGNSSWLWEYMLYPGHTDSSGQPVVQEARGGGIFQGGTLRTLGSVSNPPLQPVPLPAGALLGLTGLLGLLVLRARRDALRPL